MAFAYARDAASRCVLALRSASVTSGFPGSTEHQLTASEWAASASRYLFCVRPKALFTSAKDLPALSRTVSAQVGQIGTPFKRRLVSESQTEHLGIERLLLYSVEGVEGATLREGLVNRMWEAVYRAPFGAS